MNRQIDYLAIERKEHDPQSWNGYVKDLVQSIRYVREMIPASEIELHMPAIREKEKKLQYLDEMIGEEPREYVMEIWEMFQNLPDPDDTKSYAVIEVSFTEENTLLLEETGKEFPEKIIAEEWIKEKGAKGVRYTIMEIITPEEN